MKPDKCSSVFRFLKHLSKAGTVLHIGAHPDDETIGLLSYISRKYNCRSVYWSATRGGGGQNIVNTYSHESLGIYRTWESEEARGIDGGENLFGPFRDFGYCKNADDAFKRWGKDRLIKEIVRAIRIVQPLIVVSRWHGESHDLHGHHQAVGKAVQEAYAIAHLPECYPELLDLGLGPWKPLKLYFSTNNALNLSKTNEISGKINSKYEKDGILRINTGEYDFITGMTYQELAWNAYAQHKTQGMGVIPTHGDFFDYIILKNSRVSVPARETDIYNGLDNSIKGLFQGIEIDTSHYNEKLETIFNLVYKAQKQYHPDNPADCVPLLLDAFKILTLLYEEIKEKNDCTFNISIMRTIEMKIHEFSEVIASCLGLELDISSSRRAVTPDESVWITAKLWNNKIINIDDVSFKVICPDSWHVDTHTLDLGEENNEKMSFKAFELFVDHMSDFTTPYWLEHLDSSNRYIYNVEEKKCTQKAFGPEVIEVQCQIKLGGNIITIQRPALKTASFQGGYHSLPLSVVPPISLNIEQEKILLLKSKIGQKVELKVTAQCNDEEGLVRGRVKLNTPDSWTVQPEYIDVGLKRNDTQTCSFIVTIPVNFEQSINEVKFVVQCKGRDYKKTLVPVRKQISGLPITKLEQTCEKEKYIIKNALTKIHIINAQYDTKKKYAYIVGGDENVVTLLINMGIKIHCLTDDEIKYKDLQEFDSIIVGIRAFLLRESLKDYASRFINFVEKGGTLIVQYQSFGFDNGKLMPYQLNFTRPVDRVTDETALINIIEPEDRVFNHPNQIISEDFNKWIFDRGLYFMNSWTEQFTPLLSCADKGEEQKLGGLLKCNFGKGIYIYTGYSFFRQIEYGVSGAVRLFFNLISI